MDWIQLTIFIMSVVGLFLWNRTESRSDMRNVDSKLEGQNNLIKEIKTESKEFHGRLCALEERYILMMEKFNDKVYELLKEKKGR